MPSKQSDPRASIPAASAVGKSSPKKPVVKKAATAAMAEVIPPATVKKKTAAKRTPSLAEKKTKSVASALEPIEVSLAAPEPSAKKAVRSKKAVPVVSVSAPVEAFQLPPLLIEPIVTATQPPVAPDIKLSAEPVIAENFSLRIKKALHVEDDADPSPDISDSASDVPPPVAPSPLEPNASSKPSPMANRQVGNLILGPDGQPRKLTKFERWKLRKEKFKLIKQQRYLERQAARGGPAGDQANTDADAPPTRGPQANGSAHGNNGERVPRPEVPLGPPEACSGLLELQPGKGFGYLRMKERGFNPLPTDPFVTPEMIRQLGLRDSVWIEGIMQRSGRGAQVTEITAVNGREPNAYRTLPLFEELTAINPNKRFVLETVNTKHTTRLIDFIAPIGRGQRGLIVAPPRAGKTTILQHVAEAVRENYSDTKLIVLLVDERPEEVTEMARALPGAEIMASNNDRDPRDHVRVAHMAIERARRLVEAGEHVFVLLDSITRLARAFNNAMRGSGGGKGSLSGGVDARALEGARRLFAAARNTREAGSLTIVATALIETNSRADELIFQEFKGTGNMELVLDRSIAQRYVYPAVDIFKSGTRREELLLPPHQMEKVHLIRRGLAGHKPVEAAERLLHFMNKFDTNAQMLIEIKSRE